MFAHAYILYYFAIVGGSLASRLSSEMCPFYVFLIRFPHPDWVALQTRQEGLEGTGEIRLRDLVKESLRMRPSRLIVGEVRAEECLDLLLALNAGLPGMCTLHANSAREVIYGSLDRRAHAGSRVSSIRMQDESNGYSTRTVSC